MDLGTLIVGGLIGGVSAALIGAIGALLVARQQLTEARQARFADRIRELGACSSRARTSAQPSSTTWR